MLFEKTWHIFRGMIFILLVLAAVHGLYSQGLPPIQKYNPIDYKGENQNWAISQSVDRCIYVANNSSLLEFDGEHWNKYPSPNNGSVIRSLTVHENRIYTGSYMEFGFWEKDIFKNLVYRSLTDSLNIPLLEDEQFWNITAVENHLLFQSLQRIYSYNLTTEKISLIEAETDKPIIFDLKSGVYFQKRGEGIFRFEQGKLALFNKNEIFLSESIVGLFQIDGKLFCSTENAKFYSLELNDGILEWEIEAKSELESLKLYNSLQLKDESMLLGTISNGVYHISKDGQLIQKINQENGLNNNTVLCLFEDVDNNVWLGHDKGLSVINLKSPFTEYIDNLGKIGVVYTSKISDGYLYLGTNQGLFYNKLDSRGDFKLVKNTDGQVWSLPEIDNTLFCGHNNGTYIINKGNAELISSFPGTWNIKRFKESPDYLLQGNYNGLSILEKTTGGWQFRNKLKGFDNASRFFEFFGNNGIIVNHEYKGIFKLRMNYDYTKVDVVAEEPSRGYSTSLVSFNDEVFYGTNNAIYRLNPVTNDFTLDSMATQLFFPSNEELSSILIPDFTTNRMWAFTDRDVMYLGLDKLGSNLCATRIPVPTFLRNNLGVSGFNNITNIGKEKYLIGTSNGFVTLDLDKPLQNRYDVTIRSISKEYHDQPSIKVPFNGNNTFNFSENDFHFSYSVPVYDKYSEVIYQYKLKGLYDEWNSWSSNSNISFENLPFGDYTFEVRASVGGQMTQNEASYSFVIRRPWYWSNVAIIVYMISLIFLVIFVHSILRAYYTKQQNRVLKENKRKQKRKKIKAKKEIVQIKNEKLRHEIDAKNRELAVSTMSIIKKNEFLSAIKDQLKKAQSDQTKIKHVIRTIDKNLNNEDDWKFFEEAFNNADKNFLKKIKETHPDLTANDLKLCAYLRLNLSSKEIAPLLNISVRSVEVKRYRLRKKMSLAHESGLTDYLLSI